MPSADPPGMREPSAFARYFEIIPAVDAQTCDVAHAIRHAVYCEDLHFEPLRPDRRERDEYDSHALHCLLRHRQSDQFMGVTRLVLPPPEPTGGPLPFERTCGSVLYRDLFDPARLPRERIAEVSRLAVLREFRRRRGEASSALPLGEDDFGSTLQPRFPFIPVGLYLGAIALAQKLGIDTLFTLTEPRLARHFARFGIEVVQIGEGVEHRGLRIPSMIRVSDVMHSMNPRMKPMWEDVKAEVEQRLREARVETRSALESRCG